MTFSQLIVVSLKHCYTGIGLYYKWRCSLFSLLIYHITHISEQVTATSMHRWIDCHNRPSSSYWLHRCRLNSSLLLGHSPVRLAAAAYSPLQSIPEEERAS